MAMRKTLLVPLLVLLLAACVHAQRTNRLVSNTIRNSGSACSKKCAQGTVCEEQICQVCVPEAPTCKTWQCEANEKCEDRPTGPVCVPLTCDDIYCAAGTICNLLPEGPDCVPDIPSCLGFYCHRGTNCYVRGGHPICLPNTCQVRQCHASLTCIDTVNGALCRRGQKTRGCAGKYCPRNSKCVDTTQEGAHCVIKI